LRLSDLPNLPRDNEGPVFAAPWEAQAFAMAVKLHEAGHFTWSEWTHTIGAALHAHPERGYYENWLEALEALAERKGLMGHTERLERIADWDAAARATPHGQPIELSRSSPAPGTAR
jgi:nitrile hydratase accessory protein